MEGVEDRKVETWKAVDVYFFRGEPDIISVDGVVVGRLDVRQAYIPVVLLCVAAHGQHHGHVAVDTLDAAIGAGF